jgi:hypothetical protein
MVALPNVLAESTRIFMSLGDFVRYVMDRLIKLTIDLNK